MSRLQQGAVSSNPCLLGQKSRLQEDDSPHRADLIRNSPSVASLLYDRLLSSDQFSHQKKVFKASRYGLSYRINSSSSHPIIKSSKQTILNFEERQQYRPSKMRLLSLAALSLASLVNANFHISTVTNTFVTGGSSDDTQTLYKACPSNYWNCDCYTNNDRAGEVNTYGGDLGLSFFSVSPMCGVGQMNFYANNGDSMGILMRGMEASLQTAIRILQRRIALLLTVTVLWRIRGSAIRMFVALDQRFVEWM